MKLPKLNLEKLKSLNSTEKQGIVGGGKTDPSLSLSASQRACALCSISL